MDDWWKRSVLYHVYVRSFQDSNGDGIGDLPGLTSRVGYLAELGVDAVWLSPIHPSPNADFGYDVTDFRAVHPDFGTLDDVKRLVDALDQRGMRLVLDLVPNHTSVSHPWFRRAIADPSSVERSRYYFRDPGPGGGPPNNWVSWFGGPAWELDPASGQYYLHSFLREQPDLDWTNEAVRSEMADVLRFWIEMGVGGFRCDAVQQLGKHPELPDNPANPDYGLSPGDHGYDAFFAQQHVHDQMDESMVSHIQGLRCVANETPGTVLLAELAIRDQALYAALFGKRCFHLGIDFNLTQGTSLRGLFTAASAQRGTLPSGTWPTVVFGNHDETRVASRIGEEPSSVKAVATLLLLSEGTPIVYYGDELGMPASEVAPEQLLDPVGRRDHARGFPRRPGGFGRDPSRTPMRWGRQAFSSAPPWLPYGRGASVVTQRSDPASPLRWCQELLRLRQSRPALQIGSQEDLDLGEATIGWRRRRGEEVIGVAVGLDRGAQVPDGGTVLAGTRRRPDDRVSPGDEIAPGEVVVVALA